jgi:asparagine synthase (glutamine-hydrolysing)
MTSIVPKLVDHYGEPFADASAVPTWYLCEHTRQNATVALSGDGGDEGFAGYTRYGYARIAQILRDLPYPLPQLASAVMSHIPIPGLQPVRDFGRRLLEPEIVRYLGLIAHFPHDDRQSIYSADMKARFSADAVRLEFQRLFDSTAAPDPLGRLLELDSRTYLPDDILVKVDIASMAHSLEVRCPLLDQELMAFAATIPSNLKLSGLSAKVILKKAVGDLIPETILNRSKQGFGLPIDRWMREDLAPMASDLLLDRTALSRGIFSEAGVRRLLQDHSRGESRGLQIWNLLMLEQWFRAFIDGGSQ